MRRPPISDPKDDALESQAGVGHLGAQGREEKPVSKLPKLLPCPFCGGPAGYCQEDVGGRGVICFWNILCGGDCPDAVFVRARGATKLEAATLWNRRAKLDKEKKE